jgi:hypothetical protein
MANRQCLFAVSSLEKIPGWEIEVTGLERPVIILAISVRSAPKKNSVFPPIDEGIPAEMSLLEVSSKLGTLNKENRHETYKPFVPSC